MNNLDKYQLSVIKCSENLLVIAGPGAGKTTTLLEKIKYLLNSCQEKDILVISFTNKSVQDIKSKLNNNIKVLTFHKLAIDILNYNNIHYQICPSTLLEYIINEYLNTIEDKNKLCRYLNISNLDDNSLKNIKNLIISFINLYKTNNHSIKVLKSMVNNYSDKYLINIILNILNDYEKEKKANNYLDFDDLIVMAYNILKKNYSYYYYKYIIIDEFQDTSVIRLNLIKIIWEKSSSIITAVGDDAQSIFHFSGCDLNIFLNFNKYFYPSKIIKLKNTYRNSQELINITTKFINKNPIQINKDMKSFKYDKNPIYYIYYINPKKTFERVLNKLKNLKVMILIRNKNDIYEYLSNKMNFINNKLLYNNCSYDVHTIHSSKGLESDYVIILNVSNKKYGIPNKIIDHPILNYVNNSSEHFKYAEERRIFFVALTRCKCKVYLLIPFFNPSSFIKELKSN